MEIKQFEDKNLAHYAYAIISNGEMALVDPARDPAPYYAFAELHDAQITAVIETHPHADFVSSHLEIHKDTGATLYASSLLGAEYPHRSFDNGDVVRVGSVSLEAMNTPGHSPDSITILLKDAGGKAYAVFTGDTLFIGDCGRPDLREAAGAITAERTALARQMYYSLRNIYLNLPDEVFVFPAHGAGSLCGKGLSSANKSTIGAEKQTNWSLQPMSEEAFIASLLSDQPFVPKYFPYAVGLNKRGAESFVESIVAISREIPETLAPDTVIIDTRPEAVFKKGHLPQAINLMKDTKFETWLGSIVRPEEPFYLIAADDASLDELIPRIAKIGYETQIAAAFTGGAGDVQTNLLDIAAFRANPDAYTIVDIRNPGEVKQRKIFQQALEIPLFELRERVGELPAGKPVVIHCAAGYRSAAGSSIVGSRLGEHVPVYDLGVAISDFAG